MCGKAEASVDWSAMHAHEPRRRVSLPTYPFETQRYWIDPPASATSEPVSRKKSDPGEWGYTPTWTRRDVPRGTEQDQRPWLIFADGAGTGASLAAARGHLGPSVLVRAGPTFAEEADGSLRIRPDQPADYRLLMRELAARGQTPARVVHLWSLDADGQDFDTAQRMGFYSLLHFVRALETDSPVEIVGVTRGAQKVSDRDEMRHPQQATLRGACISIAQENAQPALSVG